MSISSFELQPTLTGSHLQLRPLHQEDFEALYQCASDPLVWELHPQPTRYQKDVFHRFFAGALESSGAFAIIDLTSDKIIGSSRYYDFKPQQRQIGVGYTFLQRSSWGGQANRELKSLMLRHAFRFVDLVIFEVGVNNLRSRKAMEKIGGQLIGNSDVNGTPHVVYGIRREQFAQAAFF